MAFVIVIPGTGLSWPWRQQCLGSSHGSDVRPVPGNCSNAENRCVGLVLVISVNLGTLHLNTCPKPERSDQCYGRVGPWQGVGSNL